MARKISCVLYEGTDRFNDLPDDVLHHILSFLKDAKSAVQTSILSKRWRCMWKGVRALHLREASLRMRFETFVRNFLSLRSRHATLDNVSFSYRKVKEGRSVEEDFKLFDMVLGYAAGLRVLSIRHLYSYGFNPMAESIMSHRHHESLEKLELVGCLCVPLGTIAKCFRMLTCLELQNCDLEISSSSSDDDDDPFADLPRLSCLKLVGCRVWTATLSPVRLRVTGHQLRSLQIGGDGIVVSEVLAPKLRSFDLSGNVIEVEGLRLLNLASLGQARVHLWCYRYAVAYAAVMYLLDGLRYAESLDLCFEDRRNYPLRERVMEAEHPKRDSKKLKQLGHHDRGDRDHDIIIGSSRFDDLPDDILHRVLSFLDIRFAVQTSALSGRWRNQWKDGISALRISKTSVGAATSAEFRDYVSRILQSLRSHHEPSTVTSISFQICGTSKKDMYIFDAVMKYAAATATGRHRLQDLSISWDRHRDVRVGFGVLAGRLAAQSLETLRLDGVRFGVGLVDVHSCGGFFGSLKTLELSNCDFHEFGSGDRCARLSFDDLPSLECLKLLCCTPHNSVVVSLPHLSELEINRCPYYCLHFAPHKVIAPKLRSLKLSGDVRDMARLDQFNLPSLDHASIRLVWRKPVETLTKRAGELNRAFENFLLGMRNAKSLDLCFRRMAEYINDPMSRRIIRQE
ncbi:unnamed protein product [Linum tenue]|uniref:F-box domain-containing protein n=1 Tax=Linum tenue TaxID=586396 RepID=A0AAV0M1A4_9ROSI|nr:unnamed protein product [Linum tenue]